MKLGAEYLGDAKCRFVCWSPIAEIIEVKIFSSFERIIPMTKDEKNYWHVIADDVKPDSPYMFRINNNLERPDPASNYQPNGVHSSSQIVNHFAFSWNDDNWKGIPLREMIIYELHIGTFTQEGTFTSAISKIKYLKKLGINAVEIMPVAQFAGSRNWGYDGTYIFAPQNSYGGPEGLKAFINELHKNNIAVIIDVVYNHFGPEGNYINQFAPFFNSRYKTPWGNAINFDNEYSDGVKEFYFQNALYWFEIYHADALRLDAVHSIYDFGANHFLKELNEKVADFSGKINRPLYIIAESDLNDNKIINPISDNGYGCNAQWSDDFHHAIHSLITGEKEGYYLDFGTTEHLITALNEKFYYSGKYSQYRKRKHGNSAEKNPAEQFVIFIQNHDQVGNRAFGERLSSLVSFETLKTAAAVMILSPYIPLIFMGEEYGELNPFLYFVSHSDPDLIKNVRNGRKEEFASFNWKGEIPDPQSDLTFNKSKLNWDLLKEENHKILYDFYGELIRLRKESPALNDNGEIFYRASGIEKEKIILIEAGNNSYKIFLIVNFNKSVVTEKIPFPSCNWKKILDSSDEKWGGPGSSTPEKVIGKEQNFTIKQSSFSLYELEKE